MALFREDYNDIHTGLPLVFSVEGFSSRNTRPHDCYICKDCDYNVYVNDAFTVTTSATDCTSVRACVCHAD